MKWSYGVTTVPKRFDHRAGHEPYLPITLASLAKAGFDKPWLFVDGATTLPDSLKEFEREKRVTFRASPARTAGNWVLSAYELYVRDPAADRYAVFQDDFVTYRNLRQYLEACPLPDDRYWNLYSFQSNQEMADKYGHKRWYEANQLGRSAVALIFSRKVMQELLSSSFIVERFEDPFRGWRIIDGGIVTALSNRKGIKEWVHNPSLTQHIGTVSSMMNKPHQQAPAWRGENFDAMDFLKE